MKKFLVALCLGGFLCAAEVEAPSQGKWTIEMRIAEVASVRPFAEDGKEGAFFRLSDGSRWFRTWWEGPIYNLQAGQKVALIPMTEQERAAHQHIPLYKEADPYWIVLAPSEEVSPIGIAFQMQEAQSGKE
jgi:hypothetical protein